MVHRPSAAERARTIAYGIGPGLLALGGVEQQLGVPAHATDQAGRPLVLVPVRRWLPLVLALRAHPPVQAVFTAYDLSPVPVAARVRGRAWLAGGLTVVPPDELPAAGARLAELHPWPELLDLGHAWTVLRLEIAEIEIVDAFGYADVDPREYAEATPDPFVTAEAGLLQHLNSDHRADLAAVCARLDPGVRRWAAGARAVGLDRYGLWIRVDRHHSPCDLRASFRLPALDLDQLRAAYQDLLTTRGAPAG